MVRFLIILLFVILICPEFLYSQKYDFKWLLGYSFADNPNDTGWGSSIMDFNTSDGNPVFYEAKNKKIDFYVCSANISDELGNYLFASNGIFVEDSTDQLMENGDELSKDYEYPEQGDAFGQELLIIPFPGYPDKYLLLKKSHIHFSNYGLAGNELFYSVIDMNSNQGKGSLIKKNISILKDTLDFACLNAVKHANGRDWWVIVSEDKHIGYYIFLASKDGIKLYRKQNFNGIKITGGFGQSYFSNNGKYFATATSDFNQGINNNNIYFFNFDRCEGLLGNFEHIVLPYQQTTWATGCAFSQDNKYFYAVTIDSLYQFAISNGNLSNMQLIDGYDGYQELVSQNVTWLTEFGMLQQAPDGRIYGTGPKGSFRSLDVINKPNDTGKDCNFKQHSIKCPTIKLCIPSFPYFQLGPIDDSVCDSLDIDNIPWAHWRYDQDTLDYLKFEFTDLSAYEVEEWYWNFGDPNSPVGTSRDTNPIHTFSQNGVYDVCLIVKNKNGADTLCRTITIGTVSTQENDNKILDIQTWPNPCKDFLIINVLEYNPQKMILKLFNSIGEQLISKRLYQGSNSIEVEDLQSGIYFISILENGKEINSEKFIKL
jgi:hypothetical protein